MDLHSGLAYWIVKNSLYNHFNPLTENYHVEVAIVGSGITGALVAHELCQSGIQCAVFDKRTISTGSTAASTALLQYEIDMPLSRMIKVIGEKHAVVAYQASLKAIDDIDHTLSQLKIGSEFERVSSLWIASYKKDMKLLEEEFEARIDNNLPVEFLDSKKLLTEHRINAPGALKNRASAQIDSYSAATGLFSYHLDKKEMDLFSHTEIVKWQDVKDGYELQTKSGKTIKCKYVVVAAGYEAVQFLPEKVMDLLSTYALISKPVKAEDLWPERSLIWETQSPYFYMRTTSDNRMIIGGEDEDFVNPVKRDDLLRGKIKKLESQFRKIYPNISFETEMAWCGTFSSTKDSLPYIGSWPGKKRMLFALGYGGNGITFSMIAAQMIRNIILENKDERMKIFGFGRRKK